MVRDPVQAILDFNRGFDPKSLNRKLGVITESPFAFFRATFHLFASDMLAGPFHKLPIAPSKGRIVADLHTENFGGFRGITGELVYDINDFDDTAANQPYEYDLRRLLTSLILGGTESGLRIGDAVNASETAARHYFAALTKYGSAKRREELAALHTPAVVRRLLKVAAEKPRDAYVRSMAETGPKDRFEFKSGHPNFRPVDGKIRAEAEKRFPYCLAHCVAPSGAHVDRYRFQDMVFRYAGKGSLGKHRYAVLMHKGNAEADDYNALRVVEWKDSSDSPLEVPGKANRRKEGKSRNRAVFDATLAFQLVAKRYLGYLSMFARPMQARELGANDCRFNHTQYSTPEKLEQAAGVFGGITARAHLLASMGAEGPRKFVARSGVIEDRLVHRLVAFATSYSSRVHEDFDEVERRRGEIAKQWKA
jgi:uncharacterized protein (DUF2252 family)